MTADPHDDALDARLRRELPAQASLPGGPTLAQVRARARRRRWRPPVAAAGIALAATALFALSTPDPTGRNKGVAALPDGAVRLEAVAEGPDGLRALDGPDATVAPDERVIFRVHAAHPGRVWLREGTDADAPLVLAPVTVAPGAHSPGGTRPQSWRPDTRRERATYQAVLCPPGAGSDGPDVPAGCAVATLPLRWAW